ncbi:hypothetical protein [Streptomyces sp. NPDC048410]|uniref:hypothetical protein n=1 Tax=Streptomyces sp. NPDC048410 TaxID=3365545 RepID=UPI003714E95C
MPKVSSVVVPYAAYLRVYEPLAAFPEPERDHWTRYARRADRPTYQDELRRSLADLLPTPPVPVPVHESADAFVLERDGVVCVCPWRTRLRGWQALAGLGEELPTPVLDAVLPPLVRDQAAQDYERWLEHNPGARSWIRGATWQIPLNWFVLVADEERRFEPRSGGTPAMLRYRTPMVQARRRVARSLRTLRDTVEESPLIDGVLDVGRWLEEFHPRSVVELDYGGLVHAVPGRTLEEDHSAADVAAGIDALRRGDGSAASLAYGRLAARWRSVRDLRSAN